MPAASTDRCDRNVHLGYARMEASQVPAGSATTGPQPSGSITSAPTSASPSAQPPSGGPARRRHTAGTALIAVWGDQRNLAEKGKGPIVGVQIRDNVFGASRVSRCAVIAPTTSTPTVSGNVYLGGTVVTVRRG